MGFKSAGEIDVLDVIEDVKKNYNIDADRIALMGFSMGGATLELGNHPIADDLRSLGLPRSAVMSVWMERMRGRFESPEAL